MSDTSTVIVRKEILDVADAVAREKGIKIDEVLTAMELAIQKASRAKYGHERNIQVEIDRKTGEISLFLCHDVVEEIENETTQLTLKEAKKIDPNAKMGDVLKESLPPIDFGRVAAQTARQVIFQQVREVERQRHFEEYKNRIDEIIHGQVKRVEFGNVMVGLAGQIEAILQKDQLIPRETFRPGDRIRAYISDVRREARGSQIFLSRTHPNFMAKLFAQEVPEIYDGEIEIKAVARDPGSRAKIAVVSRDKSLDPVGACVGMRGTRVQSVVGELKGEKVDIIPWSSDTPTFVVNALVPAEAKKVLMDEENDRIEVVVPDDQLSLAIGRRGQNVRLASMLTGMRIDVISEKEDSERRTAEMKKRLDLFLKALDVDDVLAHLLINEGFETVEEVAFVEKDEFLAIEGFEADLVNELQMRARKYLDQQETDLKKKYEELKIDESLRTFSQISSELILKLGEKKIKTLDDLADLASDELLELLPELSDKQAKNIIRSARQHWFKDEKTPVAESDEKETKQPNETV